MTRSLIRNFDYTTCPDCSCVSNMDVCPKCVKRDIAQRTKREGHIVAQAVTLPEAAAVADEMVKRYEAMSANLPDGIVEHDDEKEGTWK